MNTLRQAVHEYLSMRRNLGFKLRHAGNALLDFVTFMEQRKALYITETLALVWAQQPVNVQPAYWAQRLSYVRGFARHRSATDSRTQIPSPSLLPFRPKRAKPYLYSDEEVQNLLRAALSIPQRSGRCALLPWTYYCLSPSGSAKPWSAQRLGAASGRSTQSQASRCRSRRRGVDGAWRQVRQGSPDPVARFGLHGPQGLHGSPRSPLGRMCSIVVPVCLKLGKPTRHCTDSPYVLCTVS